MNLPELRDFLDGSTVRSLMGQRLCHGRVARVIGTYALHMVERDRTDPSVGRSRVRERGTSGHAAAH